VGLFIGLTWIAAAVVNYVKRDEVRGTWAESPYRWQIRTFWFALAWFLVGWLFILTFVGALIGVPILLALTVWLIYRIVRGWLRLGDHRRMYV
jgi:uncharacterized membrane protein